MKIFFLILSLLVAGDSFAFLPLLSRGGTVDGGGGGGTCDCEGHTTVNSYTSALYTTNSAGGAYAQSFVAAGTGTSVTVTLKYGAPQGTADPAPNSITVEIRVDDDTDLTTYLAQGTMELTASGDACMELTATSELTATETYYFGVQVNENYANRINNIARDNTAGYTDGTYYVGDNGDDWDFTGDADVLYDLYFSVCIGSGCSCP